MECKYKKSCGHTHCLLDGCSEFKEKKHKKRKKNKKQKVKMGLICPKCNSFLKFGDGHNSDPQNCVAPNEQCTNKDCDFVIFYEEKEPDNIDLI